MGRSFILKTLCALTFLQLDWTTCMEIGGVQSPLKNNDGAPSLMTYLITPNNTADVVGSEITLKCASLTSSTLTWIFWPLGASVQDYDVVVGECVVNPDYANRIRVVNDIPGQCDLVLISAAQRDVGTYSCFQTRDTTEDAFSAQVAVILEEPKCSMNTTDLFDNEYVALVCSVNYTNNISPMLINWVDDGGEPVFAVEEIMGPGYNLSRVIFQAHPPELGQYKSAIYFSPSLHAISKANNIPDYQYIWYSEKVQVKNALMVPVNTTAGEGEYVNMTCRRRSVHIAWTFIPLQGGESRLIASECEVVPSEEHRYSVDNALYACNLIIESFDESYAGLYTCEDIRAFPRDSWSAALTMAI